MTKGSGLTFREILRHGLSSTAGAYDQIAPRFDGTSLRTPDPMVQVLADHVGPVGSIGAALDIGCGTGAVAEAIRPLCREMIVGLDLSYGMLQVARQASARWSGSTKVVFCRGSALAMPLQQGFDLVVTAGMLVHLPRRRHKRFVAEVARVLQPGGRFVFLTADLPSRLSWVYWVWKAFNAVMHIRNLFWRPAFHLSMLNFHTSRAVSLLRRQGFEVQVRRGLFGKRWPRAVVIVAIRRSA